MKPTRLGHSAAVYTMLLLATTPCLAQDKKSDKEPLRMTTPVACSKIYGFGSYEALRKPRLTVDDKLVIYYETTGHTIEKTKDGYRSLLSEDGQVRKKGTKDLIWKKEKMFVYEAVNKYPPYQVYLKTDVSLKGLPEGDYEIDLTLKDELTKPAGSVTKSVGFSIYRPEERSADPAR